MSLTIKKQKTISVIPYKRGIDNYEYEDIRDPKLLPDLIANAHKRINKEGTFIIDCAPHWNWEICYKLIEII